MANRRILRKLLEVHDLPTIPVIMVRILETLAEEDSSASDLTALIEEDHAISARILRLANSAFYGMRHPVDSIRRGVVVLGFNEVRQLALATSVFDAFAKRQQFAFDPEDFWIHALGAARAAQLVAETHREAGPPGACFTAGLLHDIGKYILALVLKAEYQEIVAAAQGQGRPLRDVELEKLGMTHTSAGRWLAEKWRFPPLIANAIGNLHRVASYTEPDRPTVAIVALADQLSRRAGFGLAGDVPCAAADPVLLSILRVTNEGFEALVEKLTPLREEAVQFLGLLHEK